MESFVSLELFSVCITQMSQPNKEQCLGCLPYKIQFHDTENYRSNGQQNKLVSNWEIYIHYYGLVPTLHFLEYTL